MESTFLNVSHSTASSQQKLDVVGQRNILDFRFNIFLKGSNKSDIFPVRVLTNFHFYICLNKLFKF